MSEIEKMMQNVNVKKHWNSTPYGGVEEYYPPFTAEKLINLVMFLINKGDFDIKKGSVDITFESFTSCIAGLINNIWQSLTEEEKQQIKEILE